MVDLLAGPWGPLLIFLLRVTDVSMATVRILFMLRGHRALAPVIGFFEILIWVLAIGAAIQNLDSPLHLIAYAGGYASGTAVGMWIEGRLALGLCSIFTISRGEGERLAAALRVRGWGVTEQKGDGRYGPVDILYTVVRRRDVPKALTLIETEDPDAFVTVQGDARAHRGWLGRPRHL